MNFYDEYELLELIRDDGVKTFQAREKATGRAVTIHLFSNPAAPYQAELLRKIGELPERESARVTARGSHLGAVYLVTDSLAEYGGLLEWISAATKAGGKKSDRPPDRPSENRAENAALPLSVVTEPAEQLRLNKEFADLFATGQRPAFPSSRPVAPKPGMADPNEATHTMSLPVAHKPPAFDPNEATQPLRIPPGSHARAGTFVAQQSTVPAPIPSSPVVAQPVPTAPTPQPSGKSKWLLVMLMAAICGIGILAALFLLFLARRAHYL